jgi:hypothetical protein
MTTPIDPPSTALATQAASTAIQEAKSLINKFLGPACEEVGECLGETLRLFRMKTQIRILKRANKILEGAGIRPKTVNLKTLVPLLEAAGLEDDSEMAERWASLLASSANPDLANIVEPSFVDLLKQLTPLQARILDCIYQHIKQEQIPISNWHSRGIISQNLQMILKVEPATFRLAIDNLIRLRLIGFPSISLSFINNKDARFQLSNADLLCGTALGQRFISVCTAHNMPDPSPLESNTPSGSKTSKTVA